MQVVGSRSSVWMQVGIGSSDAAALFNCHSSGMTVLGLWAEIVGKRDVKERKRMKKVQLDQGTGDWLDWRKLGIGGSEVGAVVGANPYKGSQALDIWRRKLPSDHPDAAPEVEDNPAMARGRRLEPAARQMYEDLFGWKMEPVCVIHPDYPHARCSLDGCRDDEKLIGEIKCSGFKVHSKYVAVSHITDPFERQYAFAENCLSYRYQVQWQLLITGADACDFIGYNPDMRDPADRFVTFTLYPEPTEMQRLLERANEFWRFVEDRQCPPPEWVEPCWRLPYELQMRDGDGVKIVTGPGA